VREIILGVESCGATLTVLMTMDIAHPVEVKGFLLAPSPSDKLPPIVRGFFSAAELAAFDAGRAYWGFFNIPTVDKDTFEAIPDDVLQDRLKEQHPKWKTAKLNEYRQRYRYAGRRF